MSEPIEGTVLALARGGEGVVDTTFGRVFVRGVVPGEVVRISGPQKHAGALRSRLLAVVTEHEGRREPLCPHVEDCGGCTLMHVTPAVRRAFFVRELERATGLQDVAFNESPVELGYRRRARLHFAASKGGAQFGYRASKDRRIVSIQSCVVLEPAIEQARALLSSWILQTKSNGEVTFALGEAGKPVAWIRSDASLDPSAYRQLDAWIAAGQLAGVALLAAGQSKPALFGDPREHAKGVDGQPLIGPPFGFAQANASLNALLVAKTVQWSEATDKSLLELYAGHGNITMALLPVAKEVYAVEQSADAVRALEQNAKARGRTNLRATPSAVESLRARRYERVVVDPPREGLEKAAVEIIGASRAERVVYVSCDLSTLERDVHLLAEHGYVPAAAEAFDMFPQTAHVESLVVFTLAKSRSIK